ncbi:MAG TPA: hypothetical protein V6C81_18380 [Planktothrix sp.]|jgi:hypothetical protein
MKKIVLNIDKGSSRMAQHAHIGNCCRHHMKVLPGYGDKNFRFPDDQTLVANALARIEKRYGTEAAIEAAGHEGDSAKSASKSDKAEVEAGLFGHEPVKNAHSHGSKPDTTGRGTFRTRGIIKAEMKQPIRTGSGIRFDRTFVPGLPTHGIVDRQKVITKLPDAEQRQMDGTVFLVSSALAIIQDQGKNNAIVAELFDPLAGAVNWAREHMPAKYQQAIASLSAQLDKLQQLYLAALPRVLAVLAAQNPDVDPKKLEDAAVEVLNEELVQILTVLRIWTDAFAQRRDGMYKQLEAVIYTVETAFKQQTHSDGANAADIHTVVFQVGNVFVARFSNQGPATFPGTRGPIGAHAIEVRHDQRNQTALSLVLFTHEFRHDIWADVEGLAAEETHAVISQVQEAFTKGEFKFSAEKVNFGRNQFDTIDIICKMIADNIGEIDADIAGGVLQSGPAFLYNMVPMFAAYNSEPGADGIFKSNRLIRASSFYELSKEHGQVSLDFLPHPPDYIRAYIVAAALEEIGFNAEAEECRRLADQAVGSPLPSYIAWGDVEGKSKAVIKIAFSDLKQVAPVIARAIIRTKMKSLGGKSMFDIVNWNRHRQDKVDLLTKLLMNGSSELPAEKGDMFATYIAAAATMAFWGLCKSGVRPLVAAASVEENALKMIFTARDREEAAELAKANVHEAHGPCNCGRHPEAAAPAQATPPAAPAAAATAKPAHDGSESGVETGETDEVE